MTKSEEVLNLFKSVNESLNKFVKITVKNSEINDPDIGWDDGLVGVGTGHAAKFATFCGITEVGNTKVITYELGNDKEYTLHQLEIMKRRAPSMTWKFVSSLPK